MPGERGECVAIGERGEVATIELGAARKVGDVGEGTLAARLHDALRAGFGEAAHEAQAEAKDGVRAKIPALTVQKASIIGGIFALTP
jgi:hypothetical protein